MCIQAGDFKDLMLSFCYQNCNYGHQDFISTLFSIQELNYAMIKKKTKGFALF